MTILIQDNTVPKGTESTSDSYVLRIAKIWNASPNLLIVRLTLQSN